MFSLLLGKIYTDRERGEKGGAWGAGGEQAPGQQMGMRGRRDGDEGVPNRTDFFVVWLQCAERRWAPPPRAALSGWPSPAAPLPSRAPSPLLHPPSSGPRGGAVTARALCGREGEKEGEGSKGGKNGRESRRGVGGAAAGHGGMRGRAYLVELWGVCGQGEGGLGASASSPPRKAFRSKGGGPTRGEAGASLALCFWGWGKGWGGKRNERRGARAQKGRRREAKKGGGDTQHVQ